MASSATPTGMHLNNSYTYADPSDQLSNAIAQGNTQAVRDLLNSGASRSRTDSSGLTPIEKAMQFPAKLEIAELLLEYDVSINEKSQETINLLFSAVIDKKVNLVRLLLDHLVDPSAQDLDKRPLLFHALEVNSSEIVELLLRHGADVTINYNNDEENKGFYIQYTPLLHAVDLDEPKMVNLLLDHGADVNRLNERREWAPLHLAVNNGNAETTRLLVQRGATVDLHNGEGLPPIYYALKFEDLEMANLLYDLGADIHIFCLLDLTLFARKYASVDFLLNHQYDIEKKSPEGQTLLLKVAKNARVECAQFLCEKKANVNAQDDDDNTAMHLAVMAGNQSIIKLLMDHGALCDIQNKKGEQPEDLTHDETLSNIFWNAKTLAYKGEKE